MCRLHHHHHRVRCLSIDILHPLSVDQQSINQSINASSTEECLIIIVVIYTLKIDLIIVATTAAAGGGGGGAMQLTKEGFSVILVLVT